MSVGRPFRILSLDGGGVRGAYTAAVLAQIEENTGKRLVEHFDLVAGTSTGGIIAIGLGLGLPASRILHFYETRSDAIFPSTGVHRRFLARVRQVAAAKHNAAALDTALQEIFGDRLLGESSCRLVIPSYDAVAGDVHVFKTAHSPRVLEDYKRRAADVARATSAAPTYLPMFVSSWGQRFLDGGVWANCPSTSAILEAVGVLGAALEDIHLLSVGTTTPAFSAETSGAGGGILQYGLGVTIVELLMQAQAAGSFAQTKLLLKKRAMRIDTMVNRGRFQLDDARRVSALVALGVRDGRHRASEVAARFLHEPAPPFSPFQYNPLAVPP